MCGRIIQTMSPAQIAEYFGVDGPPPNTEPAYYVAPSEMFLAIRWNPETKKRTIDKLKWGLIPAWNKDPKGGRKPINAMAETVNTNGMFRSAFKSQRCLVPVSGFFEWWSKTTPKQHFAIAMEDRLKVFQIDAWDEDVGEFDDFYEVRLIVDDQECLRFTVSDVPSSKVFQRTQGRHQGIGAAEFLEPGEWMRALSDCSKALRTSNEQA